MSEPYGVQDLIRAEPSIVWYLDKARFDHATEQARDNLGKALNEQRVHFQQTGSLPNLFARVFFTLAGMVHVPVWCTDEMDILIAMSLRRQVKRAKDHLSRCYRDKHAHHARRPADYDN